MRSQGQTAQDALFEALAAWAERFYGQREQLSSVTLRFRSGRRAKLDVPELVAASIEPDQVDTPSLPPARHGPGFRSVYWFGTEYNFTPLQAPVVQILWECWEDGTPDVPDESLRNASGSDNTRLAEIFRGNSAWGAMIVEGATRGTHRLSAPNHA
jgi:hypothetical protein